MSTFSVKRWDEFQTDDTSLTLVPPEHHPYAWLAPRWWYRGDRIIYETCAKVINNDYQVYIDGYTPAMEVEMSISGSDAVDITYHKDIRRIAVTQNYAELFKEDGEYIDIDLDWKRNEWRIVRNTLPPLTEPLAIAENQGANWVTGQSTNIGDTVEAKTAGFTGGVGTVIYRYRWQTRATSTDSWINSGWIATTNAKTSVFYTLSALGQIRLQSQAKDDEGPLNSTTGSKTISS